MFSVAYFSAEFILAVTVGSVIYKGVVADAITVLSVTGISREFVFSGTIG